MRPVCTTFRDTWMESALDAPSDRSVDAHSAACAACAAWADRRRDHGAALSELARRGAPAELAGAVAADLLPGSRTVDGTTTCFEARLERRLPSLPRRSAPAVLDRLVGEEMAAPEAARIRRFVGDLERPAVPGALAHRLALAGGADRGRPSRRRWTLAGAAAAALLAIGVMLTRDASPDERPFTVHYGRPPTPDELAVGLVDGWTGGILRAPGGEERR